MKICEVKGCDNPHTGIMHLTLGETQTTIKACTMHSNALNFEVEEVMEVVDIISRKWWTSPFLRLVDVQAEDWSNVKELKWLIFAISTKVGKLEAQLKCSPLREQSEILHDNLRYLSMMTTVGMGKKQQLIGDTTHLWD